MCTYHMYVIPQFLNKILDNEELNSKKVIYVEFIS